jgi:hypothetical protein
MARCLKHNYTYNSCNNTFNVTDLGNATYESPDATEAMLLQCQMWPDTLKELCRMSWDFYKRPTPETCENVRDGWK